MNPELTKAINELAITVLGLITTVFIPWAFTLFREWAKARIETVKNAEARNALNDALSRLDLTAETVVKEINQTIRDEVVVDGKISKDEAKSLLTRAYNRTLNRLPADAKATLETTFGNKLQAVVVGKIEKKVGDDKPCPTI